MANVVNERAVARGLLTEGQTGAAAEFLRQQKTSLLKAEALIGMAEASLGAEVQSFYHIQFPKLPGEYEFLEDSWLIRGD